MRCNRMCGGLRSSMKAKFLLIPLAATALTFLTLPAEAVCWAWDSCAKDWYGDTAPIPKSGLLPELPANGSAPPSSTAPGATGTHSATAVPGRPVGSREKPTKKPKATAKAAPAAAPAAKPKPTPGQAKTPAPAPSSVPIQAQAPPQAPSPQPQLPPAPMPAQAKALPPPAPQPGRAAQPCRHRNQLPLKHPQHQRPCQLRLKPYRHRNQLPLKPQRQHRRQYR